MRRVVPWARIGEHVGQRDLAVTANTYSRVLANEARLCEGASVTSESGAAPGRTLHLEKDLAAPPERVFAACVEAEKLAEWWGPAGFTSTSLELDVREGGRYRITMQPPEGDTFHLRGEFREIEAPRRLVYTFVWEEPDPDDQETVVTLTFVPEGEDTRLVLDQGPFKTEARYELHRAGWTETLERLGRAIA